MPAGIISTLAKTSGKSEEEVERLWNKAKKLASQSTDSSDPQFWPYAMGILKRMLKTKSDATTQVVDTYLNNVQARCKKNSYSMRETANILSTGILNLSESTATAVAPLICSEVESAWRIVSEVIDNEVSLTPDSFNFKTLFATITPGSADKISQGLIIGPLTNRSGPFIYSFDPNLFVLVGRVDDEARVTNGVVIVDYKKVWLSVSVSPLDAMTKATQVANHIINHADPLLASKLIQATRVA